MKNMLNTKKVMKAAKVNKETATMILSSLNNLKKGKVGRALDFKELKELNSDLKKYKRKGK